MHDSFPAQRLKQYTRPNRRVAVVQDIFHHGEFVCEETEDETVAADSIVFSCDIIDARGRGWECMKISDHDMQMAQERAEMHAEWLSSDG